MHKHTENGHGSIVYHIGTWQIQTCSYQGCGVNHVSFYRSVSQSSRYVASPDQSGTGGTQVPPVPGHIPRTFSVCLCIRSHWVYWQIQACSHPDPWHQFWPTKMHGFKGGNQFCIVFWRRRYRNWANYRRVATLTSILTHKKAWIQKRKTILYRVLWETV